MQQIVLIYNKIFYSKKKYLTTNCLKLKQKKIINISKKIKNTEKKLLHQKKCTHKLWCFPTA